MIDAPQAELLRRLSHDLRSPLNVLGGVVKELDSLDEPVEKKKVLSLAQRALNRLTRLTDRLSLAARIEAGLEPTHGPVELSPLIQSTWNALQSAEPRSKISLLASGEARWTSDHALLAALVGELLINGLKNARSTVTVQLEGSSLSIDDDGKGVDEAALPTLFTRVQPGRAGLGLGLPMASALAGVLGLTLKVERARSGSLSRFVLRC